MYWQTYRQNRAGLFSDFENLHREVSRLFAAEGNCCEDFGAVETWTDEQGAGIRAEIPGVASGDLKLQLEGNSLKIEGTRRLQNNAEAYQSVHRERSGETFSRTFKVPYEIDREKVSAKLEHGLLTVNLPRSEASRPRTIEIQTN